MENFEQNRDPIEEEHRRSLENEEFRSEIKEEFADKLEDISFDNPNIDDDLPERVREGEKAGWSSAARDVLLEAAREFGMGRGDMPELEDMFLEEEDI